MNDIEYFNFYCVHTLTDPPFLFSVDNTKRPGLDTLEENIDKSLFFAELEQDRDTPINYSELNKGLSATDQSRYIYILKKPFMFSCYGYYSAALQLLAAWKEN